MDLPALYDDDLHAWALHQAAVLRGLKASRLPLPNDLDLEHVAEEIEDLGNEQRFQVESNIVQALIHLVKLAGAPEDPAVAHWLKAIAAFLDTAEDRFTPSMRRAIDMGALWTKARRRLAREAEQDGLHPPALPDVVPFTLDEFVGGQAAPRALAARLGAVSGKG